MFIQLALSYPDRYDVPTGDVVRAVASERRQTSPWSVEVACHAASTNYDISSTTWANLRRTLPRGVAVACHSAFTCELEPTEYE
ncbi:hypothetical protein H5410_029751 [Solanum commersonii]|uniref:Uncharacterized protein n=1 Tax=Solanum commersonii TaxID=4109 RepID=A0A9J5YE47_SOLCO|nr:hypothetical protein H5410_029751 [Solanum commersonii]